MHKLFRKHWLSGTDSGEAEQPSRAPSHPVLAFALKRVHECEFRRSGKGTHSKQLETMARVGVGSKAPPLPQRHPGVSGNPSPARTRSPLLRGKFVFKRYHLCEALPVRKAARQTRELSHRLGILSPRGWQSRHLQNSERLRCRVRSALARRRDCSPHILQPGRLRGGRRLPSLLGVPPVLSRPPPRPRSSAPASLRPRIPWRAERFIRLPTLSAGFLRRPARVTRADPPRPRSPPPHPHLTSPSPVARPPRSRLSSPAPATVQVEAWPDLPFGLSLLSASQSARRSGICTETLGGWSRQTGHAQKPSLALVSSRKLSHSGGSSDFGES